MQIALSGDSIICRKISTCRHDGFLKIVEIFRSADVAYTHLETAITDYHGPEVYPSAEPGGMWLRSPLSVAEELKWMGIDLVSSAHNHSLDYAYGGLYATWDALNRANLVYAGTGRNLGEARAPAYLDTADARIALISMTSTFPRWTRAGDARPDMKGRPGVNPLGYHYSTDVNTLNNIYSLAVQMGWWVTRVGKELLLHAPGLHQSVYRFVESNEDGIRMVADQNDVEGNLRSVMEARAQADLVVVSLHTHEWDPKSGLHTPAGFVRNFAHACIDAGADIFLAEGSHSLLRGIEIYDGKPIFYDPGDLIRTVDSVSRFPSDFYARPGLGPEIRTSVSPSEALKSYRQFLSALVNNPPGGYLTAPILGIIVPVCRFERGAVAMDIRLFPATHLGGPRFLKGLPTLATGDEARAIIDYLGQLSEPYGTKIAFSDGVGIIRLS